MNTLRSFGGCLVAIAPLALSLLAGFLTVRLLRDILPPFPVGVTGFIAFSFAYLLLSEVKDKLK